MLKVKDLQLKYGATDPLRFELAPGNLYWLKGQNGAGKSTLLLTMMGFIPAKSGVVLCEEKPVGGETFKYFAYLPQKASFNFGLTVQRVLELAEVSPESPIARKLGIVKILNSDVTKLSGGEAQRVLLNIALSRDAKYLLLDEPFASQDSAYIVIIKELLEQELTKGKSILIASHIEVAAKEIIELI